ncbi:MAG: J domain-containing protein [Halolamina sp.]
MLPGLPTPLPSWLVSGLALGVAASVVAAVVFALGERYVPDPEPTGHRIDGIERQRADIRALFRAADEPFHEDYQLGTTTIAFYLPARDVAITFDPQAYLRLADGDSHVVLCEHEMPAGALLRRLPFDIGVDPGSVPGGSAAGAGRGSRASRGARGRWREAGRRRGRGSGTRRGPGAGRGPGGTQWAPGDERIDDAFDELGLSRDADADAVQSAYRQRVKELHPDQGGSEEAFKRLQRAYTTAKEHAS